MKWFTRMFTLPKRYNSLSDIARDPLGSILNTAQWAVPLAMGLPKGFASLPQLLRNPSLITKWSLGNAPAFFGTKGAITTQSVMNWFKNPSNLALVAGGLTYLDQSRRAREASKQLDMFRNQLSGLGELERIFNTQLLNRRLGAVETVLDPSFAIAQLRAVETDTANRARRMMDTAGVKSLRSVENALVRTAGDLARQRTLIPLQYAQATLGIPLGMQHTSLVANLLGQKRADELLALQQLIPALLQLYAYTRGITPTQTTLGGN
jgi:hypothetical protein